MAETAQTAQEAAQTGEPPRWQKSFISALLNACVDAGFDPREKDERGERNFQVNYRHGTSSVGMALPKQRIALVFTNDEYDELLADGWAIIKFSTKDLDSFGNIMDGILDVGREIRKSKMTTPKQTSKAEDMLINLLVSSKFNLPVPERDYTFRRDDGTELTVPDLAWERMKVCVYVDGGYWHFGKDVEDQLNNNLKLSDKEKRETGKRVTLRSEKDSKNRRYINARLGWQYIECSAEKIVDDPEYLHEVAEDIKAVYLRESRLVASRMTNGSAAGAENLL